MIFKDSFENFQAHIIVKGPLLMLEFLKLISNVIVLKGIIANGVRKHLLYSFALNSPPGQKIFKEHRINFFKDKFFSFISYNILFRG